MVVSCFDIASILSDKAEGDLVPLSIGPLGSDDEWKKRKTFGMDRLDKEEEAVGSLSLKAVDGDGNIGDCVKRIRETVIVALSIFSIRKWDDSTIEGGDDLC